METAQANGSRVVRMSSEQGPSRQPPRNGTTIHHSKSRSERRSQHRHSKHSKRIRSLQIVNLLLLVVLVVAMVGWINAWVDFKRAESERFRLALDLRTSSEELSELRIRSAQLTADLNNLVNDRLPDLIELKFDHTLAIGKDNVRNITFRKTGIDGKQQYEYSAVLENATQFAITPNIQVLLFDEVGIQTGSVKISKEAATSNSDLDFLSPGEIRAYTSGIPAVLDKEPKYFLVLSN